MKKILLALMAVMCCGVSQAQQTSIRSDSKVIVDGTYYYVHTIKAGETLSSLSRAYFTDNNTILGSNPGITENLRAGDVIKIPVQQSDTRSSRPARNATVHTVNKGEAVYSIAKRYAVSIQDLISANPGLDPARISVGQKITIPKNMIGSSTQTDIKNSFEQYTEALSDISDGFRYHLVQEKETLYSIGGRYGVDVEQIRQDNSEELKDGLKFGSIIKIRTDDANTGQTSTQPREQIQQPSESTSVTTGTATATVPPRTLFPRRDRAEPENVTETQSRGVVRHMPDFFDYHDEQLGTSDGALTKSTSPRVAIMLPFTNNGTEEKNFIDFYNGALIALADLKKEGISATVDVYDTKRSEKEVERLFRSGQVNDADLIIGPVYNNEFTVAAEYAYSYQIPIVSPLATVRGSSNRYAYQATPSVESKYTKLSKIINEGDYNIIVIYPETGTDQEFVSEITGILPQGVHRINYSKGTSTFTNLNEALSTDRENLIVIPTSDENVLDDIMVRITSVQNYVSSRGMRPYRISTIGTARWARFNEIDRQLFFKLGVMYVTNYYADRSNSSVVEFDNKFLETFSYLPDAYSYRGRGYDITKLFVTAVYNGISPSSENIDLLQVDYDFRQDSDTGGGKWVNDQWMVVRYNPDFTIKVE